ncbi:MAG: hypothetical protein IJ716_13865 [Lachnospiraceae bacterium]|nr:hypothetical protein [Lachnospiraceae bacterium]
MNQKNPSSGRFAFVLLIAVCLFLVGCGRKYANLEEYIQSSPMPDDFTNMSVSNEVIPVSMDLSVSENTVIMKMQADRIIFGKDESVNSKIRAGIDQYFATEDVTASLNSGIDQLAETSGIDASLIAVRYEMYNLGESTPAYVFTYTK